jgi:hypothetical protein
MRDAAHRAPPETAPHPDPAETGDILSLVMMSDPTIAPAAPRADSAICRGVVTRAPDGAAVHDGGSASSADSAGSAPKPPVHDGGSAGSADSAGSAPKPPADRYEVRAGDVLLRARQAESCVLRPEVGDRVLVSAASGRGDGEPGYILAVLERPTEAPRVWQAPGAAPVSVSAERIEVVGARAVGVRAPSVSLEGETATLTFRAATLASEVVRGVAGSLVWVSEQLSTVAERSMHQAGSYVRKVTGVDTIVAEHMARTAHQTITTTTTNDIRAAKEDVHVSAKRIHMR